MSQLLPYVGLGLLFLVVLGLWVRQSFVTRAGRAELLVPRQHRSGVGRAAPLRDLGERIFGPEDWDFVSRDTSSEIQRKDCIPGSGEMPQGNLRPACLLHFGGANRRTSQLYFFDR